MWAIYVINVGDFRKYHSFLFMVLLNCISTVDFIYHVIFKKLRKYESFRKSVCDFVLSILIIVISLLIIFNQDEANFLIEQELTPGRINMIKVWGLLAVTKLFRLFFFFFKIDKQNTTKYIINPIGNYLAESITQVLFIYILFTSLFSNIYGGKVNTWSMDLYNQGALTRRQPELLVRVSQLQHVPERDAVVDDHPVQ